MLHIRHGFKNMRDKPRRIACWALNVIRPDAGVGVTPWRSTGRRSLLFWPSTDPNEVGIHLGPRALALDYRIEPQNGWHKVGTNGDAGWIAFVWNENRAQIHRRPHRRSRIPRRRRHGDDVQFHV